MTSRGLFYLTGTTSDKTQLTDLPSAAIGRSLATCKLFASILRHENALLEERAG